MRIQIDNSTSTPRRGTLPLLMRAYRNSGKSFRHTLFTQSIQQMGEKIFRFDAGNSAHIDVARAEKGKVAVPHVNLKTRQVGVAFCVETCVGVAQNVLNPTPAKAGIVADFTPTLLPVGGADFFPSRFGRIRCQKPAENGRDFHLADAARFGTLRADCDYLFFVVDVAPREAADFARADSRID